MHYLASTKARLLYDRKQGYAPIESLHTINPLLGLVGMLLGNAL